MWKPLCNFKNLTFGQQFANDGPLLFEGKLHALSYSLFNRFNHSSGHLTAVRHQQAILKPFVNQLHDNESVLGYFRQDGATAHSARTTIAMLRESFNNRFINRNTQNIWCPRSCDVTTAKFFFVVSFEKFNLLHLLHPT
jgi:hypothetical protein